ncbi:MAG TPA: SIS domain-containing protein [Candidatus Limnocylindria bacterium]
MGFDPAAPLPGLPPPEDLSRPPAAREGPPYAMTEMIAAEPALAERLLTALADDPAVHAVTDAIRQAVEAAHRVTFTGCGTSEHAAMAATAVVRETLRADGFADALIGSAQAFELLGRPQRAGVMVAISHDGGTWATNEALREATEAGATTALITVSDRSDAAQLTRLVIQTRERDQSWCHTVGYLSPMLAVCALAAALRGGRPDAIASRALLDAADDAPVAEAAAVALAGCERLVITGSGADDVAARELALKIEEGVHLPTLALQLETVRHGHLAATNERTGLVLVLTDAEQRGGIVVERARAILRSAQALGMPAAAIVAADLGDDIEQSLTPAGRLTVPLTGRLPRVEAALLGSAIPLQQLTERLARARGINPDPIGRDDPRQAAAADA